jgi:RNA polymerase sigma factor (sigma-70 family)
VNPASNPGRVGELLEQHRTMLTAYLLHLTHDLHAAEDLVQEVFKEVLSNAGLAMKGDDLGAYLRGIGRHLSSRLFRKARPGPLTAQCLETAWESPLEETSSRQSFVEACRAALRLCLESLQATSRRLYELRILEGRPYDQIAVETGMKSPAVRMTLTRVRRHLAECVRSRVGEAGT